MMDKVILNFKKIRADRNLSYSEIEYQTDIPVKRLKSIEEGGESYLSIAELEKLLNYYRMTFDQMLNYKSRRRGIKVIAVLLALGCLCAALLYLSPDLSTDSELPGQAEFNTGADAAVPLSGQQTSAAAGELETAPETETADHAATAAESVDHAAPAKPPELDKVGFRFWGNVPYTAPDLPLINEQHYDGTWINIFPIEQLNTARPDWLQHMDKNNVILNVGTADVWTPTTIEEYKKLKEDGFHVIGLGTVADLSEPYIVEVNSVKVGFISLAGLIHNASEIASKTNIGLFKAYWADEVTRIVKEAKDKADYLFVLIDWGKRRGDTHSSSQETIAKAIISAGGDFIVGNRPMHSQAIASISGKPVFYGLGHSVSSTARENTYNFILESDFTSQLDKVRVITGKMIEGKLEFGLTPEDVQNIETKYSEKNLTIDGIDIIL